MNPSLPRAVRAGHGDNPRIGVRISALLRGRRLRRTMADDDPTGIFERMYVAAAEGDTTVPWDRGGPHPLLEPWARDLDGAGRRALVVGSGPGADAEFISALGFDVLGFDVSP